MNPILNCLFYEFSFNNFSNLYNVFTASVFSDLYFPRLIWQLHFMKTCLLDFLYFWGKEKEERYICEFLSFLSCSYLSFWLMPGWLSKVSQSNHDPLFIKTVLLIHHQKVTEPQINKQTKISLQAEEFRGDPKGLRWTLSRVTTRSKVHSRKNPWVVIIWRMMGLRQKQGLNVGGHCSNLA